MWITLSETDLLTVLSGPELAAYRAAALAGGQADPVAETVAQVVEEVRGYVGACTRNTLGPLGTIPARLRLAALALLAVRVPARVGRGPAPVRATAAQEAVALLHATAAGGFMIDQPETAGPELESAPAPSFSARGRDRGREDCRWL